MDIKSEIDYWFPNIIGKEYKIIETPPGDYNCVSYTLGIYDGWMWTSSELWPHDKIPRDSGIDGFKKLYQFFGYIECYSSELELGFDKISFYSKNGSPMHACKQFGNLWRSKLGPSVIIEHKLEWLCGDTEDAYGEVEFIMKRRIK